MINITELGYLTVDSLFVVPAHHLQTQLSVSTGAQSSNICLELAMSGGGVCLNRLGFYYNNCKDGGSNSRGQYTDAATGSIIWALNIQLFQGHWTLAKPGI